MSTSEDFTDCGSPKTMSEALNLPDSEPESTGYGAFPSVPEDFGHGFESICWGCGLRLILPSNAPIFKCGWCGAITKQNACKREVKHLLWKQIRDRCFLGIILIFMALLIGGGVWSVFPTMFLIGDLCGVFHSIVTFTLAVATISLFSLSAFCDAGTPPPKMWGSYPAVQKDELQDYTFCLYCLKPKSPRTHHCSSCGTCVLDMDHHCPFIGNCVGAANHRYFVSFLVMAVISIAYAAIMSGYVALKTVPALELRLLRVRNNIEVLSILKEILFGYIEYTMFLSPRVTVLMFVFISSIALEIGLCVLLWQQLFFIYEGRTYLTSLTSSHSETERDCRNLCRFFGFSCSRSRFWLTGNVKKIHKI